MKKKDREIWVGKNRFYLGEDNVLYVTIVGEQDKKTATKNRQAILKLVNVVEVKVSILVDLNKAGKPSSEARRKIGVIMFEHEKAGKVALFGLHPVARVIASFVVGVSKKKDIRFFKTKEKALAWLKE